MKNYRIENKAELDEWLWQHRDHICDGIKGPPPQGAEYESGGLIERPVNVAWRDRTTGERFDIQYTALAADGEAL